MNPQQLPAQDPLAQLQDIHLPAAIGLWPPAWGWWLLALVIITGTSAIIFFLNRRKARNAYRMLALTEINTINLTFSAQQNAEYLQAVSILLRRVALSGFGSRFNASLKGEEWLDWLDAQYSKTTQDFSQGAGRALLIGPYQKNPEFDRNALQRLIELWIKEHRNQWQKPFKHKTGPANKNAATEGATHHV